MESFGQPLEQTMPSMMGGPSLHALEDLKKNLGKDDSKKKNHRKLPRANADPQDPGQGEPKDDPKKKLTKAEIETKLLETMMSSPEEYIKGWQKSIISDLGMGTTLVEQLALQDRFELAGSMLV